MALQKHVCKHLLSLIFPVPVWNKANASSILESLNLQQQLCSLFLQVLVEGSVHFLFTFLVLVTCYLLYYSTICSGQRSASQGSNTVMA